MPEPSESSELPDLPARAGGDPGSAFDDTEDGDEVYGWYRQGLELLEQGSAAAAAQVLGRAVEGAPDARSLREALARAQFDARMYAEAQQSFALIVERDPADHYAHFGVGLSASRLGELGVAANHLAIAAALRPDISHYGEALRQVRATRRYRDEV